jgi:hypothetical protein
MPSMTSGSVLFVNSSGNVAQNNDNLKWDDAANALTIGSGGLIFRDADVSTPFPAAAAAENWVTITENSGTAGGVFFKGLTDADGVTPITIRGYMGTTNPTDSLPAIMLQGTKSNGSNNTTALGSLETVLQVETGASPLLTILGSGNVGIGTTSPYAPLSVSGQIVGSYFTATTSATSTFPVLLSTRATTTAFAITGITSSLLKTDANGNVLPALVGTDYSNFAFPFDVNTGYNSTSTTIGFTNGLFSTASSTFGSSLYLPSISQGFTYTGTNGLVQTIASSSIRLSWFNNDAGFLTSTNDIFTHPQVGFSATTSSLLIGTSTTAVNVSQLTIASSTASQLSLSAGTGLAQWAFRNAGGSLYLSTTTVAGTATTTTSALSVIGSSGLVTINGPLTVSPLGTFTSQNIVSISGTMDITGNNPMRAMNFIPTFNPSSANTSGTNATIYTGGTISGVNTTGATILLGQMQL